MNLRSKLGACVGACFLASVGFAQPYPPPAGQAGTTAMYKDSGAFVSWATGSRIIRGYQDVSNPSLGYASVGDSSMATGKALSNGVVSLGDGGTATCTFSKPITNGAGFDFAVFENGFDDLFLELAFVEVSSDGLNFVRFPSHSLTDTVMQTASFGSTDATKINNLAGKYKGGYGTPFDLQELAARPNLDINAITHVRIVDVVGSVNTLYATRDSYGNKVNDPWPTAFSSGGFDLDAIGVIYENASTGMAKNSVDNQVQIYPNPVNIVLNIHLPMDATEIKITNIAGYTSMQMVGAMHTTIDIRHLPTGLYVLTVKLKNGTQQALKFIKED